MNLGGTIHLNKKRCFLLALPVIILLYYIISKTGTIYKQTVVPQVNLKKILEIAIKASLGGGTQVAKYSEHYTIENKGKTKEGANMSVTTADHESHCVMLETITNEFPTVSIVSEESTTVCNNKYVSNGEISEAAMSILQDNWIDADSVNVWIDPLDATQEYTEKLFQYVTTMVCVSVNGEPMIGVIHFPFTNVTHWAWVGNGKSNTLNLKPKMAENNQQRLKITVSRSHKGNAEVQIKKTFNNREFEIDVAAGAGYKALQVATGNADIYYHVTAISKWDICAGNAILNALGGKMVTLHNRRINYADTKTVVNEDGLIATKNNELLDHVF